MRERLDIRLKKMVILHDHAVVAFKIGSDREFSTLHYRCNRKEGNMRDNEERNCLFIC